MKEVTDGMPPDIAAVIAGAAHLRELENEIITTAREQQLRFAAVTCTCSPWPDRSRPGQPAQAGCDIHGGVFITPDGRVL
jgi:hypothetical protein